MSTEKNCVSDQTCCLKRTKGGCNSSRALRTEATGGGVAAEVVAERGEVVHRRVVKGGEEVEAGRVTT